MSELIEEMFQDMANAPPQGQTGNGIKVEGDFLIEVISTKGNKGHWGPRFIVEFRVLHSSVPNEVREGSTKSWTAKWGDAQSLPDIKAFARSAAAEALEGLSEKEKDATATFMAYAAAGTVLAGAASNVARQKLGENGQPFEGDPFEGLKLRVSTKPKTTAAGFNYVKHRWSVA
jgi:hypothetical protein